MSFEKSMANQKPGGSCNQDWSLFIGGSGKDKDTTAATSAEH